MDATYRSQSLARFDAQLQHHMAILEADVRVRLAQLETRMTWRNAVLGFWLIQAATGALVLFMVELMR